ncbi:MAG: LON peptidase substrate-binding domain-containing protein [Fimbriimonadaceae bacterium]|nr:LON peptidase substrate-binding domain-containing protein [Fimbriimonadaceae bacterium]
MATELEELPLFPLNTVLFPYASVQLHVFEDRYREMVRMCIQDDRPFGIVLIRSGSELDDYADPYMVGTAVRIMDVHTYDDGRMDIYVRGERRFRIRRLDDSKSYLVGFVEPVYEHDIADSLRAEQLMLEARAEFEILVQRLFERQEFAVKVVFPPDPVTLSFTIANLLSMENVQKQRLLETTDTLERVEELLPILRAQIQETHEPSYYRLGTNDMREWISPN